ncbi:MAG: low-specificity L-threonine aldolase [Candidatus Bathyarchaeota archaeon]|nr:low-specificity L-threonine aldolase [Candidatus Bathyarchaeota archaeon]MDH5713384.1 low-specificity L-threonine aldolase [Candidatus Bathyarchaeota archaeon]
MRVVDLRSDTVTLPTKEMLEAIRSAELGDDVFREDPTVNRLEEMAAQKMGKESALLVTSGTQGNLVSILSHTGRGDDVILEADSHTYNFETGGLSAIGGLMVKPIRGRMGVLDPNDVEKAISPKDIHHPETTLVCIENTHNLAGGTVVSPSQIEAVWKVAEKHGLAVHMDGARIFNAAIALNIDVRELTRHVDSVMFCLSKGLSCPVGSLVAGSREFVEKARKWRKMLGGGMRQAGIIAAPGIIALEKMIDRLREDHRNARLLAEELAKTEGISINLETVQTNIVMFDVRNLGVTSAEFVQRLGEHGVKSLPRNEKTIRMVTHRGIEREDIEYAIGSIDKVVNLIQRR